MTRYPNRIKELSEGKGWSQAELSRNTDMTPQEIGRFWHGDRRLNQDIIKRIAKALGCSEGQLLENTNNPVTQVVGYVGAGIVHVFDDHELGAGLEEVPCPRGFENSGVVAVRVRGDSMRPMLKDGFLLFYSKDCDGVPEECINETCVVKIGNDGMMVREVKNGSKRGLYHLIAYNGITEFDAKVEWAAKIIEYRPR